MTEYRPRPRPSVYETRLANLMAITRPLTDDEQRAVLWNANRIRHLAYRKARYENDPEYREKERARSRNYWRENHGSGNHRNV